MSYEMKTAEETQSTEGSKRPRRLQELTELDHSSEL